MVELHQSPSNDRQVRNLSVLIIFFSCKRYSFSIGHIRRHIKDFQPVEFAAFTEASLLKTQNALAKFVNLSCSFLYCFRLFHFVIQSIKIDLWLEVYILITSSFLTQFVPQWQQDRVARAGDRGCFLGLILNSLSILITVSSSKIPT